MTQKLNGSSYTTGYTYDRDNRVTAISNGSTNSANTYNGFGQLTKIQEKAGSTIKVTTNITYNKTQVSQWKNNAGGVDDTFSYTYDAKGNILSISDGTYTTSYVYDSLNQLTRENNEKAGKTWTYSYDNGGNIQSKKEYDYTTGSLGTATSTTNFTYEDSDWKDLLTSVGGVSRTNDAIGNVLSYGEWTYSWQNGRQLAGMSKSGTTISYGYNADGMRISKTVNGTKTEYTYLGSQLVEMKKGSDTLHFTYDSLGPATVVYNGTTYYYLKNAQGDVYGITNSSGSRVVTYNYDAWGKLLSTTGSAASGLGVLNPLRYRGYVYDTETGFYYVSTRYYNPGICRFINIDSVDVLTATPNELTDKNLFAYCDNNPVTRKDDDGQFWNLVIGAAVGGIVGAASVAIPAIVKGEFTGKTVAKMGISMLTGAAGGLVAASGVGMFGAIATGGITASCESVGHQLIDTGHVNKEKLAKATVSGLIGGAIGGKGACNGDLLMKTQFSKFTRTISDKGIQSALSHAWKTTAQYSTKYITPTVLSIGKCMIWNAFSSKCLS